MPNNLKIVCPCGHKVQDPPLLYQACCERFHSNALKANSPEQLMRSRYAAFVLHLYDYLIATHHPEFLQGLTANTLAQSPETHWLSLEVMSSSSTDLDGKVEFQAWYKDDSGINAIHEISDFQCIGGQWLYTQGEQFDAIFPKRNQTCLCGSGKKFKQCCL
ncbi:hypothetical protein Sps_01129 [Shewanella psychrophila]|uniref:YchJ-like middle NTF2-like domain-containing protein n=1 Tax=Shewanella psychrophila TaxID=225848 RepID=A0A1S6HLA2_9GAMM|nr:YchJ family protein [Shewanella psychrophila]AQS36311.1 hypothetical protein Sps_01129 [Shewanella psychrophila]